MEALCSARSSKVCAMSRSNVYKIMSLLCYPNDTFNFIENNWSRRTLLVGDQGFNLHNPFRTGSYSSLLVKCVLL